MFDRYYQDELAYLRELGKEFSKAHPALAPMLAGPGSDPDVERLLEGVAFLTSKLRLKLDDELPEIVHSLLEILWPHFLRPIPSTTIVEFEPKASLQEKLKIPAGTYLDSIPIEDVPCHFRTCYSVDLQPVKITHVGFKERASTRSVLKIDFELINLDLATYELDTIDLFLHGDLAMMTCLYLLLSHHLKKIRLSVPGKKEYVEISPELLEPLGFKKDEAIFPYPDHSFVGYRLLLEYFLFPQKFLFFRLKGLNRLRDFPGNSFTCEFVFDRDYVYATQLTPENIRLHCTPAVNLFEHEADPIRVDHERVEYLVRPTGPDRRFYDIYSIDKVVGWLPGTAEEKRYWPLFSFQWEENEEGQIFYQTFLRPAVIREGFDTYVSFVNREGKHQIPQTEIVAIFLTCTNAQLPSELKPGDITVPTSTSPEMATFMNITKPTKSIPPPIGRDILWRLVSHLAINYLSLERLENLKQLLSLYNFQVYSDRQAARANEMKISSLEKLSVKPSRRLMRGQPLAGITIEIEASKKNFADEGDLFLMGQILEKFFGIYSSMNTYTQMVLKEKDEGEVYRWPPRLGFSPLI